MLDVEGDQLPSPCRRGICTKRAFPSSNVLPLTVLVPRPMVSVARSPQPLTTFVPTLFTNLGLCSFYQGDVPVLKEATYPLNNGRPATMVYAVIDGCCYFSGTAQPGTSINYAENVLQTIARLEHVAVQDLRYFDLQTHQSYDRHPGEFSFDELKVVVEKGELWVDAWIPAPCPPEIHELFREFIGELDPSAKIWAADEATRAGYVPEQMFSPNAGPCFEYIRVHQGSQTALRKLAASSVRLAVQADQLTGGKLHDTLIVVDQEGSPEIEGSRGYRYGVWRRNTIADN